MDLLTEAPVASGGLVTRVTRRWIYWMAVGVDEGDRFAGGWCRADTASKRLAACVTLVRPSGHVVQVVWRDEEGHNRFDGWSELSDLEASEASDEVCELLRDSGDALERFGPGELDRFEAALRAAVEGAEHPSRQAHAEKAKQPR